MPVRKPGISSRAATGFFESVKNKKTHYYESGLERDFIYLLEYDSLVKSYEEQPLTIKYKNLEGKSKRYTPDFLVHFNRDGHLKHGHECSVYEVKYEREFLKHKEAFRPKFDAANDFVKIRNWKFEVVTEKSIREENLSNFKLLDQFRSSEMLEPISQNNYEKFKTSGTFTPKEFINSISSDPLTQGQVLPWIWHMAASGQLRFDINEKITMNTKFTFNEVQI